MEKKLFRMFYNQKICEVKNDKNSTHEVYCTVLDILVVEVHVLAPLDEAQVVVRVTVKHGSLGGRLKQISELYDETI